MDEPYPPGHNPYDFILNPAPPPKKSLATKLPGSTNPMIQRVIVVVGGGILLIILATVVLAVLNNSKNANLKQLIGLVQTQNELVRVAGQGTSTATQQPVKNLAITVEISLETQQQQLEVYLASHGHKVGAKELALKQNAQTDQKLTLAQQTSTFDLVFSQTMQSQLQDYANTLKQLFNAATSETQRTLLSTDYTQAQLLLSQVPSSQTLQASN